MTDPISDDDTVVDDAMEDGRYLSELRSCAAQINADLRAVSGAAGRTRVH